MIGFILDLILIVILGVAGIRYHIKGDNFKLLVLIGLGAILSNTLVIMVATRRIP